MVELAVVALVVLLAVPLGVSLLTYAFFWYETANGPHRMQLARLSGGKTAIWIARGILSGYLSSVLLLILYPLGSWRGVRRTPADPACDLPPVILVHGLYHNASAWLLFRRRLAGAGYRNVYAMNYSSWKHSFGELKQQLDRLVGEVSRLFPDKRLILIGHSLGGLLCRSYVEGSDGSKNVAAVITLGTPHQGSKLAALGLGRLAHSIMHRSPLIMELENASSSCRTRRWAFHSPVDNMVLPNESLKINRSGWTNEETAPISHVAMLYHPRTATRTLECIESVLLKGSEDVGAPVESEAPRTCVTSGGD